MSFLPYRLAIHNVNDAHSSTKEVHLYVMVRIGRTTGII